MPDLHHRHLCFPPKLYQSAEKISQTLFPRLVEWADMESGKSSIIMTKLCQYLRVDLDHVCSQLSDSPFSELVIQVLKNPARIQLC